MSDELPTAFGKFHKPSGCFRFEFDDGYGTSHCNQFSIEELRDLSGWLSKLNHIATMTAKYTESIAEVFDCVTTKCEETLAKADKAKKTE
jgi:hypothetical protein